MYELNHEGRFTVAQIGKSEQHRLDPEIRGDGTYWFNPENLTETQTALWSRLEELKKAFNSTLFLGLWDYEGHYAIYPKGRFYRKHLDRFQNDSRRTLSTVFFFNTHWKKEDGGILRLELGDRSLEVLPEAGTAIFFLSDRFPHEVTETNRERFSFAGWFKTRA